MIELRNRGRYSKATEEEFQHFADRFGTFLGQIFNDDGQFIRPEFTLPSLNGSIDVFHGDVSFGTDDSHGTALATKPSNFSLVDENGLSPTDADEVRLMNHGPWTVVGITGSIWEYEAHLISASQVQCSKRRLTGSGTDAPSTHYFTVEWVRRR